MIEHLYVIGNGFDIFSGLNTRYSDKGVIKCLNAYGVYNVPIDEAMPKIEH